MTRYPCTMPWDVHWSVFSPRARLFGDSGGGPLLAPLDAKSWQEQNIDSTAIKRYFIFTSANGSCGGSTTRVASDRILPSASGFRNLDGEPSDLNLCPFFLPLPPAATDIAGAGTFADG